MTDAKFENNYPQLKWQFKDEVIPLEISLEIINPIVPLDFVASNYLIVSYLNLQAPSIFKENVPAFKNDHI